MKVKFTINCVFYCATKRLKINCLSHFSLSHVFVTLKILETKSICISLDAIFYDNINCMGVIKSGAFFQNIPLKLPMLIILKPVSIPGCRICLNLWLSMKHHFQKEQKSILQNIYIDELWPTGAIWLLGSWFITFKTMTYVMPSQISVSHIKHSMWSRTHALKSAKACQ